MKQEDKHLKEIINKANEVRSYIKQVFPIDPTILAMAMGIEVYTTAELAINIAGSIYFKEKKIFLNKTDHIRRKTFNTARLLGHYVLHNDGGKYVMLRDTTNPNEVLSKKELDSIDFASELLIPRDEILHLMKFSFTLEHMADYFDVTSLEVMSQLHKLGISVYK